MPSSARRLLAAVSSSVQGAAVFSSRALVFQELILKKEACLVGLSFALRCSMFPGRVMAAPSSCSFVRYPRLRESKNRNAFCPWHIAGNVSTRDLGLFGVALSE